MAGTYKQEDLLKGNAQPQSGTANAATVPNGSGASQTVSNPYKGLQGVSESTSSALGKYGSGYQQSAGVSAAKDYLDNIINNKPGDYQSQYKGQLDALYQQIMNRDPFTFDLNGDALYQQYKDQYQNLGRQAMQDTMGQAAAMTGGYGSSYATTAGNQAYQNYLTQLNNIVPDLYNAAYGRYTQEGADLMNRLNLAQSMEDSDYGRYRDTVSDWNAERDYANSDYWNKYNADYGNWQDMLNYYNQLAQMESNQWSANRDYAYNYAMNMLNNGLMPDKSWLDTAGISTSDAQKIVNANKRSGGSGGSSRRSSSSKPKSSSSTNKPSSGGSGFFDKVSSAAQDVINRVSAAANVIASLKKYK